EQEPDLVTAKLRDELSQSGIMALGHRVSPFESTADELAEDSTVAPSDHGSTYTTRWDAYCAWTPLGVGPATPFRCRECLSRCLPAGKPVAPLIPAVA